MIEPPLYRIRNDNTFIHAVPYPAGAKIKFSGWPGGRHISVAGGIGEPFFEPLNESARLIFGYYTKHRHVFGFPATPIDASTGKIYLPATHLRDARAKRFPATVPDAEATTGMPRYVSGSTRPADLNDERLAAGRAGANYADRFVESGSEIVFCGWPELGMALMPTNDAAQRVVKYFKKYAEHPELPVSPWNLYDDALYLPELPTLPAHAASPHGYAPPLSYQRDEPSMENRTYSRDPGHPKYQPRAPRQSA